MGRKLMFRLGLACGFALLAVTVSMAQQLVGPEVGPAAHGISTAQERSQATRFRYAQINTHVLSKSAFSINLFPDVSVNATQLSRGRQLRADTWIGAVQGDPSSSITLAADDSGLLFGKIEFQNRTFLIRPKAGPIHAIVELSPENFLQEGMDDGVPLPSLEQGSTVGKSQAASVCSAGSTCPSQTIDVMVVYTAQARTALGGTHEAAQTAIAAAVAEMNAANAASGVSHTYNLVFSDEIAYWESGNATTDITRLGGNFDGYMDIVHTWRDTYGADLVSLITDTGGCGIAYIQSNPTSLSSSAAFNVVRDDCLTTNRSLAHEFGHNMGLHHDWYVNGTTTPCLWHHGYVNQAAFGGETSQRWRTLMAYDNQCSGQGGFNCSRLARWSNPLLSINGDPTGMSQTESNPADASFALNRTACQVADFRASVTPQGPAPPTGLVATGVSSSAIDINWSDNATDETGYVVQRSSNGLTGWSEVVTLGANAASYMDDALPQGTEFHYRAFAFNATAQSSYSNVDSAVTMEPSTETLASSQTIAAGTSSGIYQNTFSNDGTPLTLIEEETSGWVTSRTSRFDGRWSFAVPVGETATFFVNAWAGPSSDNDTWRFSYSYDGNAFLPMFSISETSDADHYQEFAFGVLSGSTVWIRLEDSDRVRGHRSLDQVSIDHMYILSTENAAPPAPHDEPATVHVASIDASVSGKQRWTVDVNLLVHQSPGHIPVAGADVSGIWADGDRVSCVTDELGRCTVSKSLKPKVVETEFTVLDIALDERQYDAAANHVSSIKIQRDAQINKFATEGELPAELSLRQNYPNPFNPSTRIEFGAPLEGQITLGIYNSTGREVARLVDGRMTAGWHAVEFDATDLSSGVYFAIVRSAMSTDTMTMLLAK